MKLTRRWNTLCVWAVDWLALPVTELSKLANTPSFGMLSIALEASLSILVIERSFTRIRRILRKRHKKAGVGSNELRRQRGKWLYPLYPSTPYTPVPCTPCTLQLHLLHHKPNTNHEQPL